MGKKSGAKKQAKCNRQASALETTQQAEDRPNAEQEKIQIETLCRVYVSNFQPLTELKEENRRLKRAIIPTQFRTLMDRYVKPIYLETLDKIRKIFAGHYLFMSFSVSCNGNCNFADNTDHFEVINVIVGTLEAGKRGQMFIVNSVQNYSSVGKCENEGDDQSNTNFFIKLFNDTVKILFPDDSASHLKDFLLLVTESEMESVGAEIAKLNPPLIHVTCLDSTILFCEELLCGQYKKSRRIVKLVCMYIQSYTVGDPTKNHLPYGTLQDFTEDVGLPQTLPTKLSYTNFLEIAIYIFNHIDLFEKYFHANEKITSEMLLKAVSDSETRRELAMIKVKYALLLAVKQTIHSSEVLQETVTAVDDFLSKLQKWPDEKKMYTLFDNFFSSNDGYQTLVQYSRILELNDTEQQSSLARQLKVDCSLDHMKLFKYAPITTCAKHFPNFAFLKQVSLRVPANYVAMYNLIYSYMEETNRSSKAMFESLKHRAICYNFSYAFDTSVY